MPRDISAKLRLGINWPNLNKKSHMNLDWNIDRKQRDRMGEYSEECVDKMRLF